jgi:hypothetical protein
MQHGGEMFVGHYGPSFAIKSVRPEIPMWMLFVAVQLVDVAWAMLILLGVEKARIVPGITASNPLDLYYMPFTHSLVAVILWSVAAALFAWPLLGLAIPVAAVWIGVAVLSHWVLDLVVHRPDLPLYDDTMKVGLGLWNYPAFAFSVEAVILFSGMALYLRVTEPINSLGRIGLPAFGVVMLAIQTYVFFGPLPASPATAAITALVLYVAFAGIAQWLAHQRKNATAQ